MVEKSLVDYVREQLKNHSETTIKLHLRKYGYSDSDIESAFDSVKGKRISSSPLIIAFVLIFIGLIVLGGGLYLILSPSEAPATGVEEYIPEKLLDLKITLVRDQLDPGQKLDFIVELSNQGTSRKAIDAVLTYNLISPQGNVIAESTESAAIITRVSLRSDILIPSDAVSDIYKLRAVAKYEEKTAEASTNIIIGTLTPKEEEVVEEKVCPAVCDDNDKCTSDFCSERTNFECIFVDVVPCCGNFECEENRGETYAACPGDCAAPEITEGVKEEEVVDWDWPLIKDRAKELSAIPTEAGKFCLQVEDDFYRDKCFKEVASYTEKSLFCEYIEDESLRDSCYMVFVVNKQEYDLCGKLTSDTNKKTCEAFESFSGERIS